MEKKGAKPAQRGFTDISEELNYSTLNLNEFYLDNKEIIDALKKHYDRHQVSYTCMEKGLIYIDNRIAPIFFQWYYKDYDYHYGNWLYNYQTHDKREYNKKSLHLHNPRKHKPAPQPNVKQNFNYNKGAEMNNKNNQEDIYDKYKKDFSNSFPHDNLYHKKEFLGMGSKIRGCGVTYPTNIPNDDDPSVFIADRNTKRDKNGHLYSLKDLYKEDAKIKIGSKIPLTKADYDKYDKELDKEYLANGILLEKMASILLLLIILMDILKKILLYSVKKAIVNVLKLKIIMIMDLECKSICLILM